jgi:GNAT superfamily N-acetyltransferase
VKVEKKGVWLEPLQDDDREQFILDNQEAFNFGALEEFGLRDDHFEEDGQIISRETIEQSIDEGKAWRIIKDGEKVGGAVVKVDGERGELELLFTSPNAHGRGIGYAAWCEIEKAYPQVKVWGLVTPYFEKRNIHFYVNRCGFHIVEFFNSHHPDPNDPDSSRGEKDDQLQDGMFRFEKRMA